MLSRVAESVYWMSRYVERAENVARFVDVNYNLTLGDGGPLEEQWSPLVYTTGDHEDFEERYTGPTRENVLRFSVVRCGKSKLDFFVHQQRSRGRSDRP